MKHLQETYRSPVTVIPSSLDKSEIRKTGTRNPEILLDPGSQFLPVVEGILSFGGRMRFCSTALVKLAMEGEYFTIHTHQFINHFCNLTSNWVTELYNNNCPAIKENFIKELVCFLPAPNIFPLEPPLCLSSYWKCFIVEITVYIYLSCNSYVWEHRKPF